MLCRKVLLARHELLTVEHCQCGQVHLHFGPMTFRLPPDAVGTLHGVLGQALTKLTPREQAIRPNAAGGEA